MHSKDYGTKDLSIDIDTSLRIVKVISFPYV